MRIRINYKKNIKLKYTGHLDLSKIWERYLRRSNLPLAYSEGFHPQPKMNQALPLPLGMTSSAEIMDVWLDTSISLDTIETRLRTTTQPGIEIISIEMMDPIAPKIQNLVSAAEFTIWLLDPFPIVVLENKIKKLLTTDTILREKRGKQYNLRPLILELGISQIEKSGDNSLELKIRLQAKPGATGRPEEVLDELTIDPNQTRIERTKIILETGVNHTRFQGNEALAGIQ